MPNTLNSQPPTMAPTMPKPISRTRPSPVLLTSLLPMKPAIRPSTNHARIDMICSPFPGCYESASLLDDLIRAQHQRRRDRQAERLRRLEVDDQLELGGLLHG